MIRVAGKYTSNQHKQVSPMAPLQESVQRRLIAKFGEELLRDGFDTMPKRIKRGCRQVNMTPTEYFLMDIIWSYWYEADSLPWPGVETLARMMAKSVRQVQRYLKRMVEKGFLVVIPQYNTHAVQVANQYDFSPLFEKILALDAAPLHAPTLIPGSSNSNAKESRKATASAQMLPAQVEQHIPKESTSVTSLTDSLPEGSNRVTSSPTDALPPANATVLTAQPPAQTPPKKESKQEELLNKRDSSKNSKGLSQEHFELAETAAPPPVLDGETAYQRLKQRALESLNGQPISPLPKLFRDYMIEFSAALHDEHYLSTLKQVATIYAALYAYRICDDAFIQMLYDVRAQTLRAPVEKRTQDDKHINRMSYFIETLASYAEQVMVLWDEEDRKQGQVIGA